MTGKALFRRVTVAKLSGRKRGCVSLSLSRKLTRREPSEEQEIARHCGTISGREGRAAERLLRGTLAMLHLANGTWKLACGRETRFSAKHHYSRLRLNESRRIELRRRRIMATARRTADCNPTLRSGNLCSLKFFPHVPRRKGKPFNMYSI